MSDKRTYFVNRNLSSLAPSEAAVVREASRGLTDREICGRLGISSGTIGTYWTRIKSKTRLRNRVAIVAAMSRAEASADLVEFASVVADRLVGARNNRDSPAEALLVPVIEGLFAQCPLAALVIDPGAPEAVATRPAKALLGVRPADPLFLSEALTTKDRDALIQAAWGVALARSPQTCEVRIESSNRRSIAHALTLQPLTTAPTAVLAVFDDAVPTHALVAISKD